MDSNPKDTSSLEATSDYGKPNDLRSSELTIKELQDRIHAHIKSVGGYWSPLSTLARITEELGEFCAALENAKNSQEQALELADLFIITTCLANQYCAHLDEEYKKHNIPDNLCHILNEIWPHR